MRTIILGALLILASSFYSPALGAEWLTVTSSEGRFSAEMPVQPEFSTKSHGTPVGAITEHSYVAQEPEAGAYQVEYQDLPGLAMLFSTSKGIVKRAQKEFLKSTNGTALAMTPIVIDGRDAERMTYSVPGRGQGEVVFLMVGRRLYVLNASGPQVDRFFASVRIEPTIATER